MQNSNRLNYFNTKIHYLKSDLAQLINKIFLNIHNNWLIVQIMSLTFLECFIGLDIHRVFLWNESFDFQ